MTGLLSGKTAVVTGAAQGIGRAVAERLGADGASLVIGDVDEETLRATAADLDEDGYSVEAVECDVSSATDAAALADRAVESFGSLDVLVNNVGISSAGSIVDLDVEEWRRVIDVNLTGQFLCTKAVMPTMIEQESGAIVNVSSMAGRNVSYHGAANYTASKWGVIGLTKHAAHDLAPYGIRANAVCPDATLTPLAERTTTAASREEVRQNVPLGRWAQPEEQADAVAYLASEEASYVTGTVLEVDGGQQLSSRSDE